MEGVCASAIGQTDSMNHPPSTFATASRTSQHMLKNIKLVQYFGGILVAFWIAVGTLAVMAWLGLGGAADSLHEVHGNRMRKADQLAQMADKTTRNRMEILLMFQHDPSGQLAGVHDHATKVHLDNFAKRRTEIEGLWTEVREGQ